MRRAIYPGSFDPPTLAHQDILWQAQKVFEHVTVVVAQNDVKGGGLLETDERVAAWETMTGADVSIARAGVDITDVAYCLDATHIVRGIRGSSDIEPEQAFRQFVEFASLGVVGVVHFMCRAKHQHISSSKVRSILGLKRWDTLVADQLHPDVIKYLVSRLGR